MERGWGRRIRGPQAEQAPGAAAQVQPTHSPRREGVSLARGLLEGWICCQTWASGPSALLQVSEDEVVWATNSESMNRWIDERERERERWRHRDR